MLYETRRDATYNWVNGFDAIAQGLLEEWNEGRDYTALTRLTPYDDGDDFFPMWGTMWQFHENIDEEWARNNIDVMNELGFTVYDSDYGLFFGIDGAGYDFYESHWIPLYIARGLRWSKEDNE